MQLRVESSSFCQRFEMGGKKLGDFLIGADGQGENTSGFDEPSSSVDDISADCADMMEGPELDSFECCVSLFVGDCHLKLAA